MKSISLLLLSLVLGTNAFARSASECRADLVQAFGYANYDYLAKQAGGLPTLADCRNVDYSFQDAGIRRTIDNQVYLTQDKTSLIIQKNDERSLSLVNLGHRVERIAVMTGRLLILASDFSGTKTVLLVTRTGKVFELLSSSGQPYKGLVSLKILDNVLTLEQSSGNVVRLTDEQVTKRVNEPGNFRALAL